MPSIGIQDQPGGMRGTWQGFPGDTVYFFQLFHQVVPRVQTSGGVNEGVICLASNGGLDGVVGYGSRVARLSCPAMTGMFSRFPPGLELVHGSCAEGVCGAEDDSLLPLSVYRFAQFGDGGGLAGAIDTNKEDTQQAGARKNQVRDDLRGDFGGQFRGIPAAHWFW